MGNAKSNRGGKRKGAGRKPAETRKQGVTFYVHEDTAKRMKADEKFRVAMIELLEKAATMDVEKMKKESLDNLINYGQTVTHHPSLKTGVTISDVRAKVNADKSNSKPNTAPENKTDDSSKKDKKPRNLEELKALCPKELQGLDRSVWIGQKRTEYGI